MTSSMGNPDGAPLMADIMSGPTAPLTKAFLFCGWRCLPVDWLIDPTHDLAHPARQASLSEQLQSVDCICAALDCSTKSRAREIPRVFDSGRPAPRPLRSVEYPEGLPDLTQAERQRVLTDNEACSFVLSEIQALAERGGASVRENPWRSLHWALPQEKSMMDSGLWQDKRYSACCMMGARSKSQCLRHNIEEISSWPVLDCKHTHDTSEWDPWVTSGGTRVYPSHEEAEYTACLSFAIAVAASWWAVRMGKARLHVPRMPLFQCAGRREHWLHIDPRALRSWAMTPMAISLGLEPLDPQEAARVPKRGRVAEWLTEDRSLPAGCVYVGRGHHSHRLATTCWKCLVVPGHDCSLEEWALKYIEQVCNSSLADKLPSLLGKVLVCDCPWQDLCEADLLAGLVFDATAPPTVASPQTGEKRRQPNMRNMLGLVASNRVVSVSSCPIPFHKWSQEGVILAFRKLFPAAWFEGFQFPFIEDLINTSPFVDYPKWRESVGLPWDGETNPVMAPSSIRQAQRTAEGQQAGALSHRAALPPLLPFGLDVDEHFRLSLARAQLPLPTEALPVLDEDLRFAAWAVAKHRGSLRTMRQAAMGAMAELKSRWARVTEVLKSHQAVPIAQVTASRDLGLVSLLILLMSWGDTGYPFGLICGLPAVGFAPHYGVFPKQPAAPLRLSDVLEGWEGHNKAMLARLKPSKDDVFLREQSEKDAHSGFCTPPLSRTELLHQLKGQPHRLIPRCVITQSSGKQRIIDNADVGGQSERSSDSNKLVLCSPLRAAHHVALVHSELSPADLAVAQVRDAWETGGEDWPDAYRHSPMSRDEATGCIVVWWHPEWQGPAYQIYTGLLFGLPLAVTSFNRYSRLMEAMGRRFCFLLVSLYFDDAILTDWQSSKGSGQWAFKTLNAMVGTPFAEEKEQHMAPAGTFLGLDHDLSQALSSGYVSFWARERLEAKLMSLISTGSLPPGVASKLYGLANFFEQGIYGRVGCGGLAAIKIRQQESCSELTSAIHDCFEVLEAVVQNKPQRRVEVLPSLCPRFCVASDAALESPKQGSGGFLIVWLNPEAQVREAFVADLPPQLYSLWSPGDKKIAQLELMMVLYGLVARPATFRHRRGIWFIDNVAALMCLIRGRSDSPDLEKIANMIHIALFALQCWCFWEWIPSKSNWADAISRLGFADPWHQTQQFSSFTAFFPIILWHLPLKPLVLVFEFL